MAKEKKETQPIIYTTPMTSTVVNGIKVGDEVVKSLSTAGTADKTISFVSSDDSVTIAPTANVGEIDFTVESGSFDGVKTITDIEPDTDGNIEIVGGNNVDIETSGNTITISATGGVTDVGVKTINNTSPTSNGNFNIGGGKGITVNQVANGVSIQGPSDNYVTSINYGDPMYAVTGNVTMKSTDSSIDISVTGDKKLDLKVATPQWREVSMNLNEIIFHGTSEPIGTDTASGRITPGRTIYLPLFKDFYKPQKNNPELADTYLEMVYPEIIESIDTSEGVGANLNISVIGTDWSPARFYFSYTDVEPKHLTVALYRSGASYYAQVSKETPYLYVNLSEKMREVFGAALQYSISYISNYSSQGMLTKLYNIFSQSIRFICRYKRS
jgi:hypothetical protein